MGLYFSAEPWFANMGAGLYAGRCDGCGGTLMSRGRGGQIAVPKGAKFSGVRGSGVRVKDGAAVRIGAMADDDCRSGEVANAEE